MILLCVSKDSAAMHMMKRALYMVKPSTIQNCFKKAGFVIESQAEEEEILDEND